MGEHSTDLDFSKLKTMACYFTEVNDMLSYNLK